MNNMNNMNYMDMSFMNFMNNMNMDMNMRNGNINLNNMCQNMNNYNQMNNGNYAFNSMNNMQNIFFGNNAFINNNQMQLNSNNNKGINNIFMNMNINNNLNMSMPINFKALNNEVIELFFNYKENDIYFECSPNEPLNNIIDKLKTKHAYLQNIKIKKLVNNGRNLRDLSKTCKELNLKTNSKIFILE